MSDNSWQTTYAGRNIHAITVRIAAADGGVFLFVDLIERDKLTLSQNLLQKMAELNSQFDYVKLGLSKNTSSCAWTLESSCSTSMSSRCSTTVWLPTCARGMLVRSATSAS